MKFRNTLLLGLILLLLCGGYVYNQKRNVTLEQEAQAAKRLFQFTGEDVSKLRIQRLGEPVSIAERNEDGDWQFIEPDPTVRPLQVLWNRVADRLSKLDNQRKLKDNPEDLAIYGLEEPVLEVEFTTDITKVLRFGKMEPTQTNRYALLDDMLFLVDEDTGFFELNRSLFELRHRYLVNDRDAAVLSLEYARIWTETMAEKAEEEGVDPGLEIGRESTTVRVERKDADSPWRMAAPIEAFGDQEAIKAFVDEIQFGFAENHIDHPEDLRDYGLDPPMARITVTDGPDAAPQTIYLGDVTQDEHIGIYAKRKDEAAVFTITPHLLTVLPTNTESLRDKHLFTRSMTGMASIEIKYGDTRLELTRSEIGKWLLSSHDFDDVQDLAISNYLSALKQVEMLGFTRETLEQLELGSPEFTITGRSILEEDPFTLKFWKNPRDEKGETMYALQDTGDLGLVLADHAMVLKATTNKFRSRDLYTFNPNHAIDIQFTLEGEDYHADKKHGLWLLRKPEGFAFSNQSDPKAVIQALSALKGMAIQEESTGLYGLYGFDKPVLSVDITLQDPVATDGETTQAGTLIVGKPDANDPAYRLATISTREGVFRISQDLIDAFKDAIRGLRKV